MYQQRDGLVSAYGPDGHNFFCIFTGEIVLPPENNQVPPPVRRELDLPFEHSDTRVFDEYDIAIVWSPNRANVGIVQISTGQMIAPFGHYSEIRSPVYNGAIAVNRNGLWGIIDVTGAYILPPTHDRMDFPKDGAIPFAVAHYGGRTYWGILDMQSGDEIVTAIYRGVTFAGEGMAVLRSDDMENHNNNVMVNLQTGESFVFPFAAGYDVPFWHYFQPRFVNGRSVIFTFEPSPGDYYFGEYFFGIIDNQGNEIVPPIFWSINVFAEGLLIASFGASQRGIIDWDGQEILPFVYSWIEPESGENGRLINLGGHHPDHNMAAVRVGGEWNSEKRTFEGALWGFIDNTGQVILQPELGFSQARASVHNTAIVQVADGLWGLIRIHAYD